MEFSGEQRAALKQVHDWLRNPRSQPIFRLFGYAGTGKTTLAQEIARERPATVFGAFTGKAASVLRAKGCEDATTIHSLIYRRIDDDVTHRPTFVLNDDGPAARSSLIIIDECSMVDQKIGSDLLSFHRPILVLGDPMQLPPVKGAGFFTNQSPDVLLTEIHRQAAGNPILDLATRARRNLRLLPGTYGGSSVIAARDLDLPTVLQADQILVGRNATRIAYNKRMRELLGRREIFPVAGDKLVCLKNNHQLGLLNGGLWRVEETLESEDPDLLRLSLRSEDGDVIGLLVSVHRAFFEGQEKELTSSELRKSEHFAYGYALTVHKAQGSQWDHVLLFDESKIFGEDASKHLYTALTRAAQTVTVVG